MNTVEEIKAAIEAAVPGAGVGIISNPSVSGEHSLLIAHNHVLEVAQFLRDDAELALDFLSNVTGVDWLDKEISEKVKVTRTVTKTVDGVEQQVEETVQGHLKGNRNFTTEIHRLLTLEIIHRLFFD